MNSLTNAIALTDDQILAEFAGWGIEAELSGPYSDAGRFAVTHDTLDDFRAARRGWHKPGDIEADEQGALIIREAAPRKGDQRRDLYVLDFGAVRVAYQ